jgi:hypothetical protein
MRTFAYRTNVVAERTYCTLLHSADAPEAALWGDYVKALGKLLAQSNKPVHVFAVTDGGGPDPNQRRALADVFASDRLGSTTHVFTTSPFTRGIVTAFQWVARSRAVAHHPDAFPVVCEQCGIPARAVLDDLAGLQQELPPVALVAQLERAVLRGMGARA